MKKINILAAIIFLTGFTLMSSEGLNTGYDKGNTLFEEGKYPQALESYKAAEAEGAHWMLYYNIGNTYYKLKNYLQAKIYYLKALKLKPGHQKIKDNILVVNKQFRDRIEVPQSDFIKDLMDKIEGMISMNFLSILLLFSVFVLNGFIFLIIKRNKKKIIYYGITFSLILVLLLAGYHLYRSIDLSHQDTAVVLQDDTKLKSGPGDHNTVIFNVNSGLEVKILDRIEIKDRKEHWIYISASSNIAGWLKESEIRII